MKKKVIGLLILFVSTLGIEQLYARYYRNSSRYERMDSERTIEGRTYTNPGRYSYASKSEIPNRGVDCATCCRAGRFVTPECAAQCNRCAIFGSDETNSEAFDFPN